MASITKISRVSDLKLLSHVEKTAKFILAYTATVYDAVSKRYKNVKSNAANPLSDIAGNKIVAMEQVYGSDNDGLNVLKITFKDGTIRTIKAYDGETGDQGKKGKTGEQGDQGESVVAEGHGAQGSLAIVNNCTTKNTKSALSALQGKLINDGLKPLEETFMSSDTYDIMFNNFIYMDCEFTTTNANQETTLFNSDNTNHKQYVKYWTYEETSGTQYYIYNSLTKQYEAVSVDTWTDVYLGEQSGYFVASTNQLTDGTVLYVYNSNTGLYDLVTLVKETITAYAQEKDEDGNLLYYESDGKTKTTTKTDNPVYGETTSELYRGNKSFTVFDANLEAYIDVTYTATTDKYVYNLKATELVPEIYTLTGYDKTTKEPIYTLVDEEGLANIDDTYTTYYYKSGSDYINIENITKYLQTASIRYYVRKSANSFEWEEVDSLESINTDSYEEYILCVYDSQTNNYNYTRYYEHKTFLIDEYLTKTSEYNKNSITYYVKDDNRVYYTQSQTLVNGTAVYVYTKVDKPLWLDCEYTTTDEDEVTRIINNSTTKVIEGDTIAEQDTEIIEPIYIKSIKITSELDLDDDGIYEDTELKELEVAINAITDFDVKTYPENANVTDLIVEYDENVITLYEDGRIAAAKSLDTTTETTITIKSAHNPNIKASVKLKIVTPISAITLDKTTDTLFVGKNDKLTATLSPEHVSNSELIWTSTDPDNVKVDQEGNITPLKIDSTATIVATAKDGYGATAKCNIIVALPIGSISFTSNDDVFVGIAKQIVVKHLPEDATITNYTWTVETLSGSTPIATITQSGVLTATAIGKIRVSATTKDGSDITCSKEYDVTNGVRSIKITPTTLTIEEFKTYQFSADVEPETATNIGVNWSTSDESIATVDNNGLVTFKTIGNVDIIATAADGTGVYGSTAVTVTRPVSNIELSTSLISVFENANDRVTATIYPTTATTQTTTWTSLDESIATVTSNGTITGKKAGTTTIICAANDNSGIYKTLNVLVKKAVTAIAIDAVDSIDTEKSITLVANITPDDATIQTVTWASSDNNIATITEDGVLSIIKLGTVNITCTANDGSGISATIPINIIPIENKDYATLVVDNTNYSVVNGILTIKMNNAEYNEETETIILK